MKNERGHFHERIFRRFALGGNGVLVHHIPGRDYGGGHRLRGHPGPSAGSGQHGDSGGCGAGVRFLHGLSQRECLSGSHGGPQRQPAEAGDLCPGRQSLCPDAQRGKEQPPFRPGLLFQADVEGGVPHADCHHPVSVQPSWGSGLSRKRRHPGDLLPGAQSCPADCLSGHQRPGHGVQLHQPQLFQPGGPRENRRRHESGPYHSRPVLQSG